MRPPGTDTLKVNLSLKAHAVSFVAVIVEFVYLSILLISIAEKTNIDADHKIKVMADGVPERENLL